MSQIIFKTLNQAIESKVCHFCQRKMIPVKSNVTPDCEVTEDYLKFKIAKGDANFKVWSRTKETDYSDFEPIERDIITNVFYFQCPLYHYKSDITIYHHPYKKFFIVACTEEEAIFIDSGQVTFITNMFDLNQTRIAAIPNKEFMNSVDYLRENNYPVDVFLENYVDPFLLEFFMDQDFCVPIKIPLQKFPDSIEQLIDRTKIHLTFY